MLSIFPTVLHFSDESEAIRFKDGIFQMMGNTKYSSHLRAYDICLLAKNMFDSNFVNACTNSAYRDLYTTGWSFSELDEIKILKRTGMDGALLIMPPIHFIDTKAGRYKWGAGNE